MSRTDEALEMLRERDAGSPLVQLTKAEAQLWLAMEAGVLAMRNTAIGADRSLYGNCAKVIRGLIEKGHPENTTTGNAFVNEALFSPGGSTPHAIGLIRRLDFIRCRVEGRGYEEISERIGATLGGCKRMESECRAMILFVKTKLRKYRR